MDVVVQNQNPPGIAGVWGGGVHKALFSRAATIALQAALVSSHNSISRLARVPPQCGRFRQQGGGALGSGVLYQPACSRRSGRPPSARGWGGGGRAAGRRGLGGGEAVRALPGLAVRFPWWRAPSGWRRVRGSRHWDRSPAAAAAEAAIRSLGFGVFVALPQAGGRQGSVVTRV